MLTSDRICACILLYQKGRRPKPEQLPLRGTGIKVTGAKSQEQGWKLSLAHARLGEAELERNRSVEPPPAEFLKYMTGVSDEDQAALATCSSTLILRTPPTTGSVLVDRKRLLRYARAVMGNQATAVFDPAAHRVWMAADLDDELEHDAPLDISSLYVTHNVTTGEGDNTQTIWLHTHGLAELGGFDLDILRPAETTLYASSELLSSMAYAMLEGELLPDQPEFQCWSAGTPAALIPAAQFTAEGHPRDRALRDADEHHTQNRSVLCEPRGRFARLLRRPHRAARALSKPGIDEGIFVFTNAATDLMSRRAQSTISQFRAGFREFADLSPNALVKIGVPVETPADSHGGREHLWFQVHEVHDDGVDATLLNQPNNIPSLKEGQRGFRSLDQLTDWQIMLPVGNLSPRQWKLARFLRTNPQAREALRLIARTRPQS